MEFLKKLSKSEIIDCIKRIAASYGFTIDEFRLYKESLSLETCFDGYKSVYPPNAMTSQSGGKTYVDNLKVMLAQNLEGIKLTDSTSVKLKVPQEPPIGWYASEKWDGIRALWDGEKIVSRGSGSGKPKVYSHVPNWFKQCLPPGIAIDGEIWIGRGLFQKTSGLSNIKPGNTYSAKDIENMWAGLGQNPPVLFKAFDLPGVLLPFEQRMARLKLIIEDRYVCWKKYISYRGKNKFPLEFTEQILITSPEQFFNMYKEITDEKAEGIILRAPGTPYEPKRSKYMLKYKIKADAECIVIDYIPGTGKYATMLGSLKCDIIKAGKRSGVITHVGTGFNDIQRTEFNIKGSPNYIPLGSIISFSYMEMTKEGIPRHPVYRGVRHDVSTHQEQIIVNMDVVIKIFKALILKLQTEKEANWVFKQKIYKDIIKIMEKHGKPELVYNITEYIQMFRIGGMKMENEEQNYDKTGQWKSKSLQKIEEILNTGSLKEIGIDPRVEAIEELIKIPGIAEITALKLYNTYSVKNIPELRELYAKDASVLNDKQAIGLRYVDDLRTRIPREEMDEWNSIVTKIFQEIESDGSTIEMVGSYRRNFDTSGDIDFLIVGNNPQVKKDLIEELLERQLIETIISSGDEKLMGIGQISGIYRHIDINYSTPKMYPFALLSLTGSGEFNQEMRKEAINQGYSLNEKNIKKGSAKGEPVFKSEIMEKIGKQEIETEQDIFTFFNLEFLQPEERAKGKLVKK